MSDETLQSRLADFGWFSERFFSIRDSKAKIIPFQMNPLQEILHKNLFGFDDILKARKGGVSTYVVLWMLHYVLIHPNARAMILAHDHRSSRTLFQIAKTAYKHLPAQMKPAVDIDNQQEMRFAHLGSSISVSTARNADIGRGDTIDVLHCSEIAFWEKPEATMTAVSGALGENAVVFRESTANGAGTYWHKQWVRGKNRQSGYRPHFFPWWIDTKYRADDPNPVKDPLEFDAEQNRLPLVPTEKEKSLPIDEEQIRWRRRMVDRFRSKFSQEFAENDTECFLTSGHAVFDNVMMSSLFERLYANKERVLKEIPELGLKIFWLPTTKREQMQAEYVIGADTAEGLHDEDDPNSPGDFSTATVIECRTGHMAATVHGNWTPDEFAYVLSDVAKLFATPHAGLPLLGVERNEYGHATLNQLRHAIQYPNVYHEVVYDQEKQSSIRKPGWRTSPQTRPIMITDLVRATNQGYLKITDPDFVGECLTFVKNRRGRPEAQTGCHDDRVISAAIAWQMTQHAGMSAPLTGINLP